MAQHSYVGPVYPTVPSFFKRIDWWQYLVVLVGLLCYIPVFFQSENLAIFSKVTSITALIYLLVLLLKAARAGRPMMIREPDGKLPKSGKLSDTNGVGTFFIGKFRELNGTYVTYYFFNIFLPVIPLGCYRVTKTDKGYGVTGSEKWNFFEVMYLYISGWCILIIGLGVLFNLVALFA
jgi:hypothetical protein